MKLPVLHSEPVTIKPFGSTSGMPYHCDVVSSCIGTDTDEDLTFSVKCVPLISSLQGQFLG